MEILVIAFLIGLAFLLAGTVRRYGEREDPRPDWRPTDEVFVDPGTERRMRVWVDDEGRRHYVPEAPS